MHPTGPSRTGGSLLLVSALALGCGGDAPVSPPTPDERAILIDSVRTLSQQRNFDPVPPPPMVRPELVALGQALLFDKLMSGNRDISCMTCHLPAFATGDGRSLSVGQGANGLGPGRVHPQGTLIPRNSPALFNLHLADAMFWDGRVERLDDGSFRTPAGAQLTPEMIAVFEFGAASAQPMFPVEARDEMRGGAENELGAFPEDDYTNVWAGLMARLGAIPEYVQMFEAAYPGTAFADMTFAHVSNAMAGFLVDRLGFVDTPWDRFLAGDDEALTTAQLRGATRFMLLRCTRCHNDDDLADEDFHNIAIPQIGPGKGDGPGTNDDFGRERVTGDPEFRRKFKTPMLRNVELTAPYGHAGQFATLRAIVAHYDRIDQRLLEYDPTQLEPALRGTILNNALEIIATRDTVLQFVEFDDQAADDMTAFLMALTDEAARDLSHLTPATVPSGLPIDR